MEQSAKGGSGVQEARAEAESHLLEATEKLETALEQGRALAMESSDGEEGMSLSGESTMAGARAAAAAEALVLLQLGRGQSMRAMNMREEAETLLRTGAVLEHKQRLKEALVLLRLSATHIRDSLAQDPEQEEALRLWGEILCAQADTLVANPQQMADGSGGDGEAERCRIAGGEKLCSAFEISPSDVNRIACSKFFVSNGTAAMERARECPSDSSDVYEW